MELGEITRHEKKCLHSKQKIHISGWNKILHLLILSRLVSNPKGLMPVHFKTINILYSRKAITVKCTCWEWVELSFTDLKQQTNSARNSNASAHLQHVNEYEWLTGFHNLTLTVCVHLTIAVFTTVCHLPILWVKSSWCNSTPFLLRSILIISILFSAFWWWHVTLWCTGSFSDGEM